MGPSATVTAAVGAVADGTDEAMIEAAIRRLTLALATADDDTIAELVAERRALRDEVRQLREAAGNVRHLDAHRKPKP